MPLVPLRRLALVALVLLTAWLTACGGASTPTKAPDLVVGGDGGAGSQPLGLLRASPSSDPVREDDAAVPVGADDPVRGSRSALVTIVVFSDFQCPYCSKLATTFERVAESYPGEDLRFVFKQEPLPFHQHARLAAEVGQAVMSLKGSEAFWRYHDMAFRRQQLMSPDSIRAWAIAAGADGRDVEEGLTNHKWAPKVERDEALAKRLGASGTPASFVNGVSVSGAQPYEKWKDVIDTELAKAKELVQRGVSRDRVYGRMAAVNFKEPSVAKHDDDDDDDKIDAQVWKVPVATSPTRGLASALVTVVEFSDFQCPFCKRVQPTLERLRTEYGDRVRWVWKDEPLPFHPRAVPAAELARFARAQKGEAGFWTAHDKLFDAQPKLDDADLESVARAMGLDAAKAAAAIKNKAFQKAIDEDASLADDVQASGTPHFFVNGRRLVGAQPYDKFKALIDAEIANAESLVRRGVARTALYETIIKDGKSAPDPERKSVGPGLGSSPFRGAANAKVVIQEFSDFQCPFCSRAEPTVDEVLKAYPGKVKVVWRNLPLPMHPDAPLAAEAAREAFVQKGNDGFSKMRELLFKGQKDHDGLKRNALEGYAAIVGLDLKKFNKALDDGTHKASIEADTKAANDAGISGTPSFTIGPYYLSGAQPLAKFKKLVDRVLTEPVLPTLPSAAAASPSVIQPGGLVMTDTKVGTGPAVKKGDTITVHYVGTLNDGSVFDSSRKQGQPFTVEIGAGRVIKGWDQGILGMKVGGKRKLTIPSDLAYGDRAMGSVIPPKSTLNFDIELLSIK